MVNFNKVTKRTLPLITSALVFLNSFILPCNFNTVNAAVKTKISSNENNDYVNINDFYSSIINENFNSQNNDHKIIKEDLNRDGEEELILWIQDTRDAYKVEVLRKENGVYVDDPEIYPLYFQNVEEYYKNQLKKSYNYTSPIMWYYLADAQLKTNKPETALTSISKGRSMLKNDANILDGMFLSLKGEALRRTAKYDQALTTLDEALKLLHSSKFGDAESIINTYLSIAKTLENLNYHEIPREYYKLAINVAENEYGKNSNNYHKVVYKIKNNNIFCFDSYNSTK